MTLYALRPEPITHGDSSNDLQGPTRVVGPPSSNGIAKLSLMASRSNREVLDRWFRAFNSRQFREMGAILHEIASPDVIQEWPQSGERIEGRDNILAVLENYPGLPDADVHAVRGAEDKWVLTPSWTPLRITGSGDHYTIEGRVAYPNGEVWRFVDIAEFRDGKLVKLTEYFAQPFPAAEWRAQWVQRSESTTG